MSLPSARIVEEGLERSVAPPRLRPGLLSLCSVTSFRRFSVSFPHKSRRLSLRDLMFSVVSMSLPSARIEEEGLERSVVPRDFVPDYSRFAR